MPNETQAPERETENLPVNPFANAPTVARPTGAVTEATAQREIAEVQAAVLMAKRFPRDQIRAMDRIMQACARPSLAESAIYQYARGGTDIAGPSIRLAEAIAQAWGNVISGITILATDPSKSECIAYAWDLETNYRDEKRFTVKHWRDTRQGGYALKDERDIYELAANLGARRKRACILAVIPGDVIEAAQHQCEVTLKTKADITPERLKSLVDKFAEYGVTQEMIEKRAQRRLDAMTPALLVQFGKIYNSLKDGMSQVADWFEGAQSEPEQAPQSRTDAVKSALKKSGEKVVKASGMSVEDAFALADDAVKSKDWDTARDLARSLPDKERKLILDRCPK